jgi:S1-C subfamily serine protease
MARLIEAAAHEWMLMTMNRCRIACLPLVMPALLLAQAAQAAHWLDVGYTGVNLDKVSIDTDSVEREGDYRIARIRITFDAPRTNIHGVRFDRTVQMHGYDCGARTGAVIQTIAFLGENQIATSPAMPDWHGRLTKVSNDATDQSALDVACGAKITGIATVPGVITAPNQPGGTAPPPGDSSGSGIFVNTDGVVLTNVHVVRACKTIVVKAWNQPPVPATIEAVDPRNDLALLRTRADYGSPLVFRNERRPAQLGEPVGVVGYPLTGILSNEPKATFGEVNSVAGMNNDYTLLQISAQIHPGNSGGPVLDRHAQVIGVVVSTASAALMARLGNVTQNLNFAIRGELAQIFMTAHGVRYRSQDGESPLDTVAIAEAGRRSTAQILCLQH